jgi:hypothetical protein
MQRRAYLQAAAVGLTTGFAGCNGLTDGTTPTDTATTTETAHPTPTEEPTPRENPPAIDPPLYMLLLPRQHLGDPETPGSATSVFTLIDWEWYLSMRTTTPEWGPAGDEIWSFAPTTANLEAVPEEEIFITPQWGAYITAFNVEVGVGEFPNLGPEILRQCGLKADDGEREGARVVDEVVSYNSPGVTMFIGVDTDSVRDAVSENNKKEYEQVDITSYQGVDEYESRVILVSDEQPSGVVAVQTGDASPEDMVPVLRRLGGGDDSVVAEESVQWCLSRLIPGPIVTGEINGGRSEFAGKGRSDRGVARLEPFDTLMTSMNARQFTGTVQHVFSAVDDAAPDEASLRESFETESGTWNTEYHPDVSSIDASWG